MGSASSTPEVPGGGYDGYHVLKVSENSPSHAAGLEPFFDYILSINDERLNKDDDRLKQICKQNIDKPVSLTVYSSKDQSVRQCSLTPSNTWGGNGVLGLSIRHCSFEGASENIWHILDVQPNSPAAIAGIRSQTDYIIAADSFQDDRDDLFALVERFNMKPLRLYVYNSALDKCREVTITPNNNWGGEGSLGCGIGYGYLHRIPKAATLRGVADQKNPSPSPLPGSSLNTHGHSHGGDACTGHHQKEVDTGTAVRVEDREDSAQEDLQQKNFEHHQEGLQLENAAPVLDARSLLTEIQTDSVGQTLATLDLSNFAATPRKDAETNQRKTDDDDISSSATPINLTLDHAM